MSVFLARSAYIVKHEKLWQCFLIQEVLALGDMQMSHTHTNTDTHKHRHTHGVFSGESINTLHAKKHF